MPSVEPKQDAATASASDVVPEQELVTVPNPNLYFQPRDYFSHGTKVNKQHHRAPLPPDRRMQQLQNGRRMQQNTHSVFDHRNAYARTSKKKKKKKGRADRADWREGKVDSRSH